MRDRDSLGAKPLRKLLAIGPRTPHAFERNRKYARHHESLAAGVASTRHCPQVFGESGEVLLAAFDCAVLVNDEVAGGLRREDGAHRKPGLGAAEIFEGYNDLKGHRLAFFLAAVLVHEALRGGDFKEGNHVLVVAPVRAVHHESPNSAGFQFLFPRGGRETLRPPPLG